MKIEDIARVTHEANRAYCQALGDYSQVLWDNAPGWQKKSAVNGVANYISNGADPRRSHESWLAEKKADGWTYGPVKDVGEKKHPCFVPYDELPEEQKIKDSLFVAVCACLVPTLKEQAW